MRLGGLVLAITIISGVSAAVRLGAVNQYGGSNAETVAAMARDAYGNAYITGQTWSADFPANVLQVQPGGGQPTTPDAYVMKLDSSGNLVWASYLGGSGSETATGIAVDNTGSVYILGQTSSTDFPITPGALSTGYTGPVKDFVVKISPEGQLVYSATLSVSSLVGEGLPGGIAVDGAGSAYIAATAIEILPGGPIVPFEYPAAVVCKLNPAGSQTVWCAEPGIGRGYGIAVDPDGAVYVGGDGGLAKLSPAGDKVWQRRIPSSTFGSTTIQALALDSQNTIYAGGYTSSPDFPTTAGAFQQQFNTPNAQLALREHGFVLHMSADGETLASTLMEGEYWDHVLALAVDKTGNVTIGGVTASRSFPLVGAFQARFAFFTGFVSRLSGDLTTLLFSTYVGDTRGFQVTGLALADDGDVSFAGFTTDNPNTAGSALESGRIVIPLESADIFLVQLQVVAPPAIDIRGVLNSASQLGTRIAPNQSITVLADGAGPDASVLLDGAPIPITSSAPGKLVAQIPGDYTAGSAVKVQAQSGGLWSDPLLVAGDTAAPGVYTRDLSGSGEALVFHEDGTLNSPDNPAAPGSIIGVACTGLGRITNADAAGPPPVAVFIQTLYATPVDARIMQVAGIPGDTSVIWVRVPDPQKDGFPKDFKLPPRSGIVVDVGGRGTQYGINSQANVWISIKQ